MTLVLRPATIADAPAIAALYAPYVRDTAVTFEEEAPEAAEIGRRISLVQTLAPWLVAVESRADGETLLGYGYGATWRSRPAYRWALETTVYVDRGRHRRGIGHALYRALLDLLRLQGFCRAIGCITIPNEGSVGLHERFGFRLAGVFPQCGFKHGRWWDVGFWDLELQPPPVEPRETLPLAELLATPEAAHMLEQTATSGR